ncbi:MAG: HDOD domain-containing protein, partial [Desulfatitalea sp.]|nr:HDOD domain-containing protein [Desulfatitalea sp.]NNJ99915.1 HDOD domain-containing protein [Desulfatitalea sp.]
MLDPKKQTQAPKTPGISSRESAIEQLLKRIHRNDEFPSVSKHLIEINRQLAVNIEASDASELANVILKDHALTSKLLKLVNSAFFGFAAGSVSTVTRAVVLLGNENIRLAAVNLAVFEHFNSKSNTLDLKETVVNAFWSGVVARDMARMNTQVDPEEAFVCAMMCRLGKMVMIYYLPEEYQQIIRRMADNGGSETKAVRAVCGVTYDELGAAVARQWNFPSQLCENIMPLTKEALRDKRHPPNPLRALTSFVKELGGTLQDGTIESDHKCFEHLVEKYQPLLHLTKGQLSGLIKDSVEQVRRHAQALNYNLSQCDFLRQLDYLNNPGKSSNAKAGLPPSASRPKDLFGPEDAEHPKDSPAVPKNTSDIIMAGIQEMSEAMLADNDVNDVALISLEILYRSLDFQRALMFARDGRSDTMTVRFGYGEK